MAMIDGSFIADRLSSAGFSHVVWIPDSTLGQWESALINSTQLTLVRACREGEVVGICAGLMLGGAKPIAIMQCTGMFEAGDAIRNVVHDLGLPLKLVVGVRSHSAYVAGKSKDNCPRFTEPILNAWAIPYTLISDANADAFGNAMQELAESAKAMAVLLAE